MNGLKVRRHRLQLYRAIAVGGDPLAENAAIGTSHQWAANSAARLADELGETITTIGPRGGIRHWIAFGPMVEGKPSAAVPSTGSNAIGPKRDGSESAPSDPESADAGNAPSVEKISRSVSLGSAMVAFPSERLMEKQ